MCTETCITVCFEVPNLNESVYEMNGVALNPSETIVDFVAARPEYEIKTNHNGAKVITLTKTSQYYASLTVGTAQSTSVYPNVPFFDGRVHPTHRPPTK